MPTETFKYNPPHKGALGYEISTSFDREYERGTSEVRVQPRHDGRVDLACQSPCGPSTAKEGPAGPTRAPRR